MTGVARASRYAEPCDPRDAVLRRRAFLLMPRLTPQLSAAVRLAPALFHASFAWGGLGGEAPGIEGLGRRTGWGLLAREFGLPPPLAGAHERRHVAALFATYCRGVLALYVLPSPLASGDALSRIEGRATAAARVLSLAAGPVTVQLLRPVDHRSPAMARLALFGALIAGRPPASLWAEAGRPGAVFSPGFVLSLVHDAPTPLAALLMMLLANRARLTPSEALRRGQSQVPGPFRLTDPELLIALWVASETPDGAVALQALHHAGSVPANRALADVLAKAASMEGASTPTVLSVARKLALCAARVVHQIPRAERGPFLEVLRREVLATGVPSALTPALGRALGPVTFERRSGPLYRVLAPSGGCLGRGTTLAQARIRALAILSASREPGAHPVGVWERIAARLRTPVERRSILAVVFRKREAGSQRAQALLVLQRPGARPSARSLPEGRAIEQILLELTRGSAIEATPATADAELAAARLRRFAGFAGELPLAVQYRDRVLLAISGENMVRSYSAYSFANRPRACVFSSAAEPPIARARELEARSIFIECFVTQLDERQAALVYVDSAGTRMRERVPLRHLEAHLSETENILRVGPSALLSVRASSEIVALSGRRLGGNEQTVRVLIEGELPLGMGVVLEGERFGGPGRLGLEAAAQIVLSVWPPGCAGRIAVSSVEVTLRGSAAPPMARLYARSAVLRRLWAHVTRLDGA